jgi:hypothetical protein
VIEPRALERSGHSTGSVTSGFGKAGGKRTVGNDRTDAGHHERNRSEQVRADLADSCGRCGIFELGAGRSTRRASDLTFLVM